MSWSQAQQSEELYDQITILVGSAIRLLCGDAGVFIVSNEAFDPQSSTEYTLYNLSESACALLLSYIRERKQPNSAWPFVVDTLPDDALGAGDAGVDSDGQLPLERCSLFLYDHAGVLGVLHCLRPVGAASCFEHEAVGVGDLWVAHNALHLFITHLAAGLRSTLKSQSLVQEQRRLAAIFQQSAEGILTVDTALRIIDFNPAMERLTGWRESEVLGRFYYEVLRPKDRQGHELGLDGSPILQAFAGHRVINREMVISARDGQQFDVAVTASCVRSSRGEPTSGILTVRDISREREQEEQRSTFISVISHELQTPIAIIKGYASTLARTDATFDAEMLHSRLLAVEEEADRLNKLVGNLLYASRIQAGGLQMEIAPLDLSHLVETVVHRVKVVEASATSGVVGPRAWGGGGHSESRVRINSFAPTDMHVVLDVPPNLPRVMADRDRIEEVLQNLLDNAIKYSPAKREVKVACRATGDDVIVSVNDTGMGISLREQEHIFDRFHRVDDRLTRSTQGAGLGLYICRAIVEAHGGHIWVESTLHQGSTFSFSLPRVEKAQLPMVVF